MEEEEEKVAKGAEYKRDSYPSWEGAGYEGGGRGGGGNDGAPGALGRSAKVARPSSPWGEKGGREAFSLSPPESVRRAAKERDGGGGKGILGIARKIYNPPPLLSVAFFPRPHPIPGSFADIYVRTIPCLFWREKKKGLMVVAPSPSAVAAKQPPRGRKKNQHRKKDHLSAGFSSLLTSAAYRAQAHKKIREGGKEEKRKERNCVRYLYLPMWLGLDGWVGGQASE